MECLHLWVLCTYLFTTALCQSNDYVLNALGDHGDRITDLEHAFNSLRDELKGTRSEVAGLREENRQLNEKIKSLNDSCNNHTVCCQTCTPANSQHAPDPTLMQFTPLWTTNASMTTSAPISQSSDPSLRTSSPISQSNDTFLNTQPVTISVQTVTTAIQTTPPTHLTTPAPSTKITASSAETKLTPVGTTSFPATISTPTLQTTSEPAYEDCKDAVQNALPQGGIANIKLGSTGLNINGSCDKDGWLVIQRRQDGSQNFSQGWDTYKKGFGDLSDEFWLGNENIYLITSDGDYTLRIEMEDWAQNKRYAEYQHFRLNNEFGYYALFAGSYAGNAGDSFHYQNSYLLTHFQMPFSTPDRDNDRSSVNCAGKLTAGWWFNDCYSSNLNGPYLSHPYGQRMLGEISGQPTLDGTGIEWYPFKGRQYSMKKVEMKIQQRSSHSMG